MAHKCLVAVALTVGAVLSVSANGQRPESNGASSRASRSQRSNGSLVAAATMSAARAAHTATALSDGRVLVAGGFLEKGDATGAELYDSRTGRFSPLPPMIANRHSHTATRLQDGTVLIAGGYGEGTSTLATAEVFDPATSTFSATGALVTARAGHVAVLLQNGKVLITGGVAPGWDFLSSAELYDPATGRFTATGSMTTARESHVAVRLANGQVLVVGGHRGRRADITLHTSAEIYDPAAGAFTHVGDMRIRRHKHDAVLLADGRVLITGGSDERDERGVYDTSELFDPATRSFTAGPLMKLRRYKHAGSSLLLSNGVVLIAGGAPQAETFDPRTRSFSVVSGEVTMAGQFSAVAPMTSGGALVTGGYGHGSGPQSAAWLYRP